MKVKRKNILFFSCEPGGAEVLIPSIKLALTQKQLNVTVVGYGHALMRFKKKHIDCVEEIPVKKNDFKLLDQYKPDCLITSAASLPKKDMSEKYLWRQAKMRGIPSIALLDQWQNYVIRFSGKRFHEKLAYLPDYINCIDAIGYQECRDKGIEAKRLVTLGHPYLDQLQGEIKKISLKKIKKKIKVRTTEKVLLFVSEEIQKNYGKIRGYDQYDALRLFIKLANRKSPEQTLLVKLHPKENINNFKKLLQKKHQAKLLIIQNELSSLESLRIADEVYGMTSIMLIEAYILGKKVCSLQPGLKGNDHGLLSRYKIIPVYRNSQTEQPEEPKHITFKLQIKFKKKEFLKLIYQCTS